MADTRVVTGYAATAAGYKVEKWQYNARPLGEEDIEIKISHCGICGSDLHTISGGWGAAMFPVIPGHEIVGKVTKAGPGVKHLAVGDRVGVGAMVFACLNKDPSYNCAECKAGEDPYCEKIVYTYNSKYADGSNAHGGYADYVRVSGNYAFKIPENIPSDVAAPLLCAGATVYTPLAQNGVGPGDRVGIVGIGGLGHLGIQFAKALGAVPVAISNSPSKEEEAKALGAEVFVNMKDPESVAKAFRSVNMLLLTADASNLPYDTYLSFIKPRGKLILVGLPNDDIKFKPFSVIAPGITFIGSKIGGIKDIKEMLALASKKNVRPVIQKLPMEKANEGIEMVHTGRVRYRVVLENPTSG
jgi:D-arabinose 1-dehydrogenase-like Zn-dependent alcohol dehydrogenase